MNGGCMMEKENSEKKAILAIYDSLDALLLEISSYDAAIGNKDFQCPTNTYEKLKRIPSQIAIVTEHIRSIHNNIKKLAKDNAVLSEQKEQIESEYNAMKKKRKNAGRPAKFNIKNIETVISMYNSGSSMDRIAKKMNCSKATVHKYIYKHIDEITRAIIKQN